MIRTMSAVRLKADYVAVFVTLTLICTGILSVAAFPVVLGMGVKSVTIRSVRRPIGSGNDDTFVRTTVRTVATIPGTNHARRTLSPPYPTELKAVPVDYLMTEPSSVTTVLSNMLLSLSAPQASLWAMDKDAAESLAGPFFGLSLFPYLIFLYFLNVPENDCPKGVVVGFATCLLFVFLTIPAAIAAKLLYGVSLADCDWLHGSAESMLTITNLATVIPFRQALAAKEKQLKAAAVGKDNNDVTEMPVSATSYAPMVWLVVGLTVLATATALVPALSNPEVHTAYLNGVLDTPFLVGTHPEPENALTVATWIIHVSSLVEFLVAMGFCWRWGDVVQNPRWKGLTWGLIPLHSSGITACVSHLFYNQVAFLVPFQAFLTCVGNSTAAFAAYRIAQSNGWTWRRLDFVPKSFIGQDLSSPLTESDASSSAALAVDRNDKSQPASKMIGFEDLGDALAGDNDYTFLFKLFAGCAVFSYIIKYGETWFDAPFEANGWLALALILVPTALNAYKWNRRSQDPTFEGWF